MKKQNKKTSFVQDGVVTMKLLNIFCPNCGAGMKITANAKVITCEYCNHDFVLEDNVKQFRNALPLLQRYCL